MNKKPIKIFRHLPFMIVLTIFVMMIVEYLGWKIILYSNGEDLFPGFFSFKFLISVFMNSFGAFLFGTVFSGLAFLIPSFRIQWKKVIHIPAWMGVSVFNLYMIVLVSIGLNPA
jgi:hypothetical protein